MDNKWLNYTGITVFSQDNQEQGNNLECIPEQSNHKKPRLDDPDSEDSKTSQWFYLYGLLADKNFLWQQQD